MMERISHYVDIISKLILIGILSIMAVVVLMQVVFRYVLNLPLFWTEELARYCLVWVSLLGAGIALKKHEHIAVNFFIERFVPDKQAKVVAFLVDIFILTILTVILIGGISLVKITSHQISPALRIPMSIPYLAIPLGVVIMMVHQLADCYQRLVFGGIIKSKIKLKLATVTPADHAYNSGAFEFARLVKEGSKGAIHIDVYPAGKLGSSEEEVVKGTQTEKIDLAVISTGPLNNLSPEIGIVDLPFLFRNEAHVDQVLDGPIGRKLLNSLNRIKGLAFLENGFRHFTNSKGPLLKPEDFKNLKLRTMENPIHLAAIRALKADAVPMNWGSEAINALKHQTIAGQDNPVAIVSSNKMNEYQKYLSLTGHIYSSAPLCMNQRKFDALKPEWQNLFLDAAVKTARFERKAIRETEQKQIEELKSLGMDIRTVEKQPFIDAMRSIHSDFFVRYPIWKKTAQEILEMK